MTDAAASSGAVEGRASSLFAVYRDVARNAAIFGVQYRLNLVIETVLMAAEPVVYLAVWQIVAREQGGEVDGFTPGRFAAYYITFGLVRTLTQIGSPQNWEYGIREGRLTAALMRPIHPVHQDLATWMGFGVLRTIAWLPVGVVLTIVFEPEFDTGVAQILVFPVAVFLALIVRSLLSDIVGMTAFWLVHIAALMAITSLIEAVMSGRIVPPELLPGWAQALSWALPYRWTVAFPIETLIGPMSAAELSIGLGMQAAWVGIIVLLLRFVWHRGVRRYGAVGG
jgi:ABC-2 type transport system permease protein